MSQTQLSYREHPWMGVFPATLCPFNADETIDEEGLRAYFAWLCQKLMALSLEERTRGNPNPGGGSQEKWRAAEGDHWHRGRRQPRGDRACQGRQGRRC